MSARVFPPAAVLVLAIMAGACMDATIKYLSQTNPVLLVAFGRYLFGAIFSFGIYWQAGRPAISAEMWRAHGVRGFLIAACAVTFFWALSVLPLAEAVTLSFIYPLLAPFVASLLLKERIRASSRVSPCRVSRCRRLSAASAAWALQSPCSAQARLCLGLRHSPPIWRSAPAFARVWQSRARLWRSSPVL